MNTNVINLPNLLDLFRENGLIISTCDDKATNLTIKDVRTGITSYDRSIPEKGCIIDTFVNSDYDFSYIINDGEIEKIKFIDKIEEEMLLFIQEKDEIMLKIGHPRMFLTISTEKVN